VKNKILKKSIFLVLSALMILPLFGQVAFADNWLKADPAKKEWIDNSYWQPYTAYRTVSYTKEVPYTAYRTVSYTEAYTAKTWVDTSYYTTKRVLVKRGYWKYYTTKTWVDTSYWKYWTVRAWSSWESLRIYRSYSSKFYSPSISKSKARRIPPFPGWRYWSAYGGTWQYKRYYRRDWNETPHHNNNYVSGWSVWSRYLYRRYRYSYTRKSWVEQGYWKNYTTKKWIDTSYYTTKRVLIRQGYWNYYTAYRTVSSTVPYTAWRTVSYTEKIPYTAWKWVKDGYWVKGLTGSVTLLKTPKYVFSAFHNRENGEVCDMHFTLNWDATKRVTKVEAYHDTIRFGNKGTIKVHGDKLNFNPGKKGSYKGRLEFPKPATSNSELHIILTANDGTTAHCYCKIPVNGFYGINIAEPDLEQETKWSCSLQDGGSVTIE